MSEIQLQRVAELLRAARFAPDATVAEMREAFENGASPVPAGTEVDETILGGRPALRSRRHDPDRPERTAGDTAVLYLHGGGYVIGSARTGAALAASLAHRVRATAYSLDYRLAPEHPHPAAVLDAVAAYRELTTILDPGSIGVAGDSAGGGLAIAMLVAARDAGLPMPAAVAVFSPWTDLTRSGDSIHGKDGIDPLFSPDDLRGYAERYLGAADPADPLVSPIHADLRGLPPLLIQVGSHELLLDDALRLAARAAAHDVEVAFESTPGAPHVFQAWAGGALDEADAALDRAGGFLGARLTTGRAHASARAAG